MSRTTYIFHCDKCHVSIKKEDYVEGSACPPKPISTWNPSRDGCPMVSMPDYKQERNYPQVAPNLPGDGVVTSYEDYKRKLAAAGQVEVGTSKESAYRMKHRPNKKRPKRLFIDATK